MAIVTFSPQVAMIADVLAYAFGQETALKIPIRGNDSSWEYSGGGPPLSYDGNAWSELPGIPGRGDLHSMSVGAVIL